MSPLPSSNLGQRILTAVVLLPALVALIAFSPGLGSWALAATLGVLGAREAHNLLGHAGIKTSRLSFLPGVALFFDVAGTPSGGNPFAASSLPILACLFSGLVAVRRAERVGVSALAAEGAGVLCGLLIGLGVGCFAALGSLSPLEEARPRLALLLTAVMSSDVFAYFAGRSLGRLKLAPTVSPGKTVEGAIGGLVGASLGSVLVASSMFPGRDLGAIVGVGVGTALAGIVGDLLESLFKRSVGAKDSGSLFPGHGGALDRMDAFLLASPLLYVFFRTVS